MSQTENKFKQRIVGAVVLVALAVIFLPMLFNTQEEQPLPEALIEVPSKPNIPAAPDFAIEEVQLPEPVAEPIPDPEPEPEPKTPIAQAAPVEPEKITEPVPSQSTQPETVKPPVAKPGIDKDNLPVSWSIQVSSSSNEAAANKLRDEYRKKGYKAYVRPEAATFKVLIGPFPRQADAISECETIKQRERSKHACFVTRYQP